MFRGFLRFVKVFNVLPNCLCSNQLFSLERKGPKGRRPRPPVRLELEALEGRLLLSTSPLGQPPASTPLVAVMDRVDQMIAVVQNEVSSIARTIAQEIVQELAYLDMQLDHIFGIDTASQNTPLNSSTQSVGNGSGNIVTMASNVSNQVSNRGVPHAGNGSGSVSNTTIKPEDSPGGPDAVGVGDYTWNPVKGGTYLASDPNNWLINNKPNTQGTVPGDNPQDTVTFDPGGANVTNGNADIAWDYKATFSEMNVGGLKPYTGLQTIGTFGVELTGGGGTSLNMIQPTSNLNLDFVGVGSVFVLDNNATITNMTLGGSNRGQFNIDGGVTTIANQILEFETVNSVQINIAQGAVLDDQSHSVLDFTGNDSAINIAGTMLVNHGDNPTNTLIGNPFAKLGNFINVNGGSLEYAGNGGITDQFQVPVYVQNGGEFVLTSGPNPGGKLIVQGTVPGKANNASVYLTGTGSTVQLSQGVTLEADNDYFQDSGILETWDNSMCTIQDGQNGKGTANITGGTVWIDGLANSYGRLNLIGSLNFGGALVVSVQGYAYNGSEGTSRDQLYVAGTLTLNKATSTLTVYTYGALVKSDFWNVITSAQNIAGDFSAGSSVPAGANMTYGPPKGKNYPVTFNG